jgi:hypothetical protein
VTLEVGIDASRFACTSDDAASRLAMEVVEKLEAAFGRRTDLARRLEEGRLEEEVVRDSVDEADALLSDADPSVLAIDALFVLDCDDALRTAKS